MLINKISKSSFFICVIKFSSHSFSEIFAFNISGSIKLIDPKADFIVNKKFAYVDPFYDLAKLNHSFGCFYDSIVNNMFSISFSKDEYELKIFKPFNYEIANFYFQKIFLEKLIDKDLLRILTSNLFLSMASYSLATSANLAA